MPAADEVRALTVEPTDEASTKAKLRPSPPLTGQQVDLNPLSIHQLLNGAGTVNMPKPAPSINISARMQYFWIRS